MTDINNNNAFLILAAGKGTRMRNDTPKVMHKICGTEMVSYSIDLAKSCNPERIGVITSDDAPETVKFVKQKYPEIEVINQSERLGTGHAVMISKDFLIGTEGKILCLYGDSPFISKNSINSLIESFKDTNNVAVSVLGFYPEDAAKYGRLKLDAMKNLIEIVEYNDANDVERTIDFCNSGIIAIDSKYFDRLISQLDNKNSKGEYYLTDLVSIAISEGLFCKAVVAEATEVMGVNSQIERAAAEKVRQEFLRNKFMNQGVIINAPETVYFSNESEIESGVEIEPNVIFTGKVKVKKGTLIRSFSYLENCVIGENNVIGPYARIRPDSELQNDVKIGNFVEIKKTDIGSGSKVNHLSYIGDSEIGKNVNIGAGTITCNYDGQNKFKTIFGDNSFIGSNSSIVAPIKIGKNTIIGAGTTVLKDIPDGKRVINKKKQDYI